MLDRALEIATDFVDAAGDDHPRVHAMTQANDAQIQQLNPGTPPSTDWRSSAVAVFGLAQQQPDAAWIHHHATQLVEQIQGLSDDLGMGWVPPPAMRPNQTR